MNDVIFDKTIKAQVDSNGPFIPNADGEYTMVIGSFNTLVAQNKYFSIKDPCMPDGPFGILDTRVRNGLPIMCEYGSPTMKPGESAESFFGEIDTTTEPTGETKHRLGRITTINENNVCAQIKDIYIKRDPVTNADIVIGTVKPIGTMGHILKDFIENPPTGVSFGMRAIANIRMDGDVIHHEIKQIITFDLVQM